MFYRVLVFCVYSAVVKKEKNPPLGKKKLCKNTMAKPGFSKNQELLIFTFSHKLIQASAPLGPGGP